MKRWMALVCLLCCLAGACRAEEGVWYRQDWEWTIAALASDDPNPVPEAMRISVRPDDVRSREAEQTEKDFANVLLLSTDAPEGEPNFGRTDAMLVCRVNLQTGDTYLLSLPEGAMAEVQGVPERIALRYINCFGGPLLAAKTINETLGLQINRYCAVNMAAFITIVDALGGVMMDLTEGEADALDLNAGKNQLNGLQALKYVKLRRQGDGALRARALLEAVSRQALNGGTVNTELKLMDMLMPAIDTNMTTDDLIDLAFALFGQETPGKMATRGLAVKDGEMLDEEAAEMSRAFLYGKGD